MALPTSGPLSLNDIAGEFGGSVPHSLSEYYGVASGIPTSGTISIDDFYGASAALSTHSLTAVADITPYWDERGYTFSTPGGGAQLGSMNPYSVSWLPTGTEFAVMHQNWGGSGGSSGSLPSKGVFLRFKRSGSTPPTTSQSAFTSLTISGPSQTSQGGSFTTRSETFATSSATFTSYAGSSLSYSTWIWSSATYWWFGSTTSNAYTITLA
jgi:hypothetical protein